jgi:RNA polymerase sigma factor (sigma-70 family)
MSGTALEPLLRHVRRAAGDIPPSDAELLARVRDRPDRDAVAELIRRHGSAVLAACRRVLADEADVEDCFQATFLVLLRRGPSVHRVESVGAWLSGVAHRVAVRALADAQRRRRRETRAAARADTTAEPPDLSWREACELLHAEVDRLLDRLRRPVLLCYFDGLTRDAAAAALGCGPQAVKGRLERARIRLRNRLTRRGVSLAVALLAAGLRTPARAESIPTRLVSVTLRTLLPASGAVPAGILTLAGVASPLAGAARRLVLLVGLLAVGTTAGGVFLLPAQTEPPKPVPADPPAPAAAADVLTVRGRVTGTDNRPVAGAKLFTSASKDSWDGRATADADGRFTLSLPPGARTDPGTDKPYRSLYVLAVAPGFGPTAAYFELAQPPGELGIRMPNDDVPVLGRVTDLDGKPVAGVKVQARTVWQFRGNDLSECLQAVRDGANPVEAKSYHLTLTPQGLPAPRPGGQATTDADGRFRLTGFGRERLIDLDLEGPATHYTTASRS